MKPHWKEKAIYQLPMLNILFRYIGTTSNQNISSWKARQKLNTPPKTHFTLHNVLIRFPGKSKCRYLISYEKVMIRLLKICRIRLKYPFFIYRPSWPANKGKAQLFSSSYHNGTPNQFHKLSKVAEQHTIVKAQEIPQKRHSTTIKHYTVNAISGIEKRRGLRSKYHSS